MGEKVYTDPNGHRWVVDPNGSYGFWSYEPGCDDARSIGGFYPVLDVGLDAHGAVRHGGGPTYRRYRAVCLCVAK